MSTELPIDLLQEYASEQANKEISSMYFRCNADIGLHISAVDKGATDVTGYTPEELVATGMMTLMNLVAPKSRNELRYNIQQGLGEGKAFASWFILRRKDSSTARAFIQGKGNVSKQLQLIDIEGYIATAKITDDHFIGQAAERAHDAMSPPSLAAADPGYVHLLNYSAEVLGLVNRLDEIEYITPEFRNISNVTPGDNQLLTSIFSPDSTSRIEESLQEVRQTRKKVDGLEVHLQNEEGIPTIVNLSLSPAGTHSSATLFRIEMPKSSRSFEAKEEIDLHSDTQPQESEIYKQAFLSNAMGMIIAEHDTNTVIEVNKQFLSLFEYHDRDDVINNSIQDLKVINEADFTRVHDVAEINGMARQHQLEIITHLGNTRKILISAQSLYLSDGTYIVYFFEVDPFAHESKLANDSDEQPPSDQVVSEELMTLLSLLKMTGKRSGRNDITKCEGFITSVLYLHDPTCQDINEERIAMDAYLGKIIKSYIENYKNSEIEYEFICDRGLVFDRALAQACGIVTVELISNSLYHAFKEGERGKITVSMIRDQTKGDYLLSVADTGVGISHSDEREESGISMVRDIAKSLRGTIEVVSTAKGAHVAMAFPIPVLF